MRFRTIAFAWTLLGIVLGSSVHAEKIRVAAYNIQFLNSAISSARHANLTETISALDADVIALEEIADRAALENIFDKTQWSIVIDDESGDAQDVAVVVRKPLVVVSPADLNADDGDFLFPGSGNDTFFPNRRDVQHVTYPGSDAKSGQEVVF